MNQRERRAAATRKPVLTVAGTTPKEMEILLAAWGIKSKLQWLREHPGKTRRDYNRGLRDNGEVWKWRRAKAEAADKAEQKEWLRDHPGRPLVLHCGMTSAEVEEYEQWRTRRDRCPCPLSRQRRHRNQANEKRRPSDEI